MIRPCVRAGVLVVGALLLYSPIAARAGEAAAEPQRFAAFLDTVYRETLATSPQLATEFGAENAATRWDDLSDAAMAARAARVRRHIAALKRDFDYAKLDEASQLQYRVFLDEQQVLLDRYRWRNHFYALNQIVGLHIDVPGVLTGEQSLQSESEALAYIQRIRAVRPAFRQLVRHMQEQARRGVYLPKTVYPLLIEQARNTITGAPHDLGPMSPIYADVVRRVNLLDLPQTRKAWLLDAARAALLRKLQPAYQDLIRLLQNQAQHSPIDGGVWQLPDGDAFYAFLIRQFTTTTMSPQQIHDLGLAEVARSHAQIAALMQRIGFKGSLREYMQHVKTAPGNYASDDDAGRAAYLDRARSLVAAMQARVTEAFQNPAPLPLRVLRTDSYKEASSPPGFYEPGTADGSRPGTVYLNLSNMHLMPQNELEDLLYHEGVPGHHMQMSTILVDRSIPRMRKVNEWWQDSAFVEGWGLYAERLGKELGFYQDAESEFGLLSGELWRATRLVVDSGLHYKHWSRAKAIQYLNDNTPSAEETNEKAVDRYLAVPGQATSFMVGMRTFVAQRERARSALGSRFDLREYHRLALSSGYIPLWALEQKVGAWIQSASPAGPEHPAVPPNPALNDMLESYWQDLLRLNPNQALSVGDTRYEDSFDDSLEDGWRDRVRAMIDKYWQASDPFTTVPLSSTDETSLVMLREQLRGAREFYCGSLFDTARMLPIDQFEGAHLKFAADASAAGDYPFKSADDYDNALRRADNYARWTDEAILRLRQGIQSAVVLPRMVVERILPQLQAHFGLRAESTEFWQPIRKFPTEFPGAERARLARAYRLKILGVIEPAYRRLYEFLQKEYLPKARSSVGLSDVPGGAALYARDVRYHTTTDLTAMQIHELGVREVEGLEAQLTAVQKRLGIAGNLHEFLVQVRSDAQQKFAARDEIIPAFQAARQRIVDTLPLLFDVLPQAKFEIRALPDSSRLSQGNGYYSPAGAAGVRPGVLWINTYAPGVTDRFNVMTIALHEGLPGHHLQTSLAQEQPELPSFRRFDFTDAYGEGWALYSESLGKDLGLFENPWNEYGYLNYAILRANRLVIDTGLHAMNWSVADGVSWMLTHSSMTAVQAKAEVERYVAYPGQALAYKVGELKIRELRERAAAALGDRFDVRAFHDQVLLGGSMPLAILERRIDRWISAMRAG